MATTGYCINADNLKTSSYSYVESEEFLTGKNEQYLYFWSPCFSVRAYCNAKPNWFASNVGFSYTLSAYDGASWNTIHSKSLSAGNSSQNGSWSYLTGYEGYRLIEIYARNTGGYNGRNHIWLTLGGIGRAIDNGTSGLNYYNSYMKGKPLRGNGSGAVNVYSSLAQDRSGAIAYFNTDKMRGTPVTASLSHILRIK